MGIADASALDDVSGSLLLVLGEEAIPCPAGVETSSENIKSSIFIASGSSAIDAAFSSEDFRNCAMPLGVLLAFSFSLASLEGTLEAVQHPS